MAAYSLIIRRLLICSLTIVVSRALTGALLTSFSATSWAWTSRT